MKSSPPPWLINGDARALPLADRSVHMCVTSPPYFGLRNYNVAGQLGLEQSPEDYVAAMVDVFREVRRVLRDDGTLWLNIGDSYSSSPPGNKTKGVSGSSGLNGINGASGVYRETLAAGHATKRDTSKIPGIKPKDLIGIPWLLAFALRADGWYLRQDCIWSKRAPMPESVRDRCTKSHEYVFLLTKEPKYFYDAEAIKETAAFQANGKDGSRAKELAVPPGTARHRGLDRRSSETGSRNARSVWTLSTTPCKDAHFATFPLALPTRCIKAGTSERGCCPSCGAPWRRVVDRVRVPTRPAVTSKVYITPPLHPDSPIQQHSGDVCGNRDPQRHVSQSVTTAWVPTCKCDPAEPVPCTVLDNFNGAGTTGVACKFLGRRYVGVELNAAYIEITRKRIAEAVPVKAKRSKPKKPDPAQPSLFAEVRP